jgi:hypothetical protein
MASKSRPPRRRVNRAQIATEALSNALAERSLANYPAIIEGFIAKGIPAEQITTRENVFTYHAWRALGRQVRKGESGVKVVIWISKQDASAAVESEGDAEGKPFKFSRPVTVFHVSQTDLIQQPAQEGQQ